MTAKIVKFIIYCALRQGFVQAVENCLDRTATERIESVQLKIGRVGRGIAALAVVPAALLASMLVAPSAASAAEAKQWPVAIAADEAARQGKTANGGTFQPLIIGGHGATEPYSWMVSLQFNHPNDPDWHFCGGTLVTRLWVVTNAHCVTYDDGSPIDPAEFQVHARIGSHNRTSGGIAVNVAEVLPHPQWDWGTGGGPVADIALLRLEEYVQLQHVEIATKTGLPGTRAAATRLLGWGVTEPDGWGPAPIQLQELDTKLVSTRLCSGGLAITVGELCIESPNNTDGPCYGDSGGPALQKIDKRWKLVGGTSRGTGAPCGVGPTIYTNTTYYRPWLFDTMRTGVVAPAVTPAERANAYKPHWLISV